MLLLMYNNNTDDDDDDDDDMTIYKGRRNMSMKSLQAHRTPGSRDECRTAPDGRRPLDQADRLEPLARLYAAKKLHPPSPSLLLL